MVGSNPVCLCELLSGAADSFGIAVDYARAPRRLPRRHTAPQHLRRCHISSRGRTTRLLMVTWMKNGMSGEVQSQV
ncbi:hypothetical protein ZWY2020_052345 [Hordeum vulgare]|nr:hypothetical protein ZWY2020_052345 [Hordeum vulgare]